jgi:hypothetical protein
MAEATITIASSTDAITMTGSDIGAGFIYDNESLSAWFALPDIDVRLNKRPNAHGTYTPDRLFANEHRIPMSGSYFGASALAAAIARNRLSAMFNDGTPVSITVTDDLGPTARIGFLVAFDPEWMHDGHFRWALEFAAPDPRRYGTAVAASTALATASSGLVWPLGSGSSFWDWGTAGTTGRIAFTNTGNTTTYPLLTVGAGGQLPNGFEVVEVNTGRTITYAGPAGDGGLVVLNSRTQRATVNGGDTTDYLTRAEWFAVPKGATYEYQFISLGGQTGAPTLANLAAPAYM